MIFDEELRQKIEIRKSFEFDESAFGQQKGNNQRKFQDRNEGELEAILKKRSCCNRGCFKRFTLPELSKVCRLWHALSPEQQTQYLSSQYKSLDLEPGPDGPVQHPKRTDGFLCGTHVCVHCFCCLLVYSDLSKETLLLSSKIRI